MPAAFGKPEAAEEKVERPQLVRTKEKVEEPKPIVEKKIELPKPVEKKVESKPISPRPKPVEEKVEVPILVRTKDLEESPKPIEKKKFEANLNQNNQAR